jgi:hypothetical protein
MLGILNPFNLDWYFQNPLLLIPLAFQLWMLVDAIRRQEWVWVIFMIIFPLFNAVLYYFLVYRAQPSATQGFELPGRTSGTASASCRPRSIIGQGPSPCRTRRRLLPAGETAEAEQSYRAAIERDSTDPDFMRTSANASSARAK